MTRAELPTTGPDDQVALDRFITDRPLTADADQLEITHEALLAAWPRLRDWDRHRPCRAQRHRQLTAAADTWTESGRDGYVLLRGVRLALAREWAAEHDADLNL